MLSYPPGVTDTTWITISGRTITWQTIAFANVGAYTFQITGSLPTTPVTSLSVQFTLNVIGTCLFSNDQPTLVVDTPTTDQIYTQGMAGSVTPAKFTVSPAVTYCA